MAAARRREASARRVVKARVVQTVRANPANPVDRAEMDNGPLRQR
jgi:hypothetical protein